MPFVDNQFVDNIQMHSSDHPVTSQYDICLVYIILFIRGEVCWQPTLNSQTASFLTKIQELLISFSIRVRLKSWLCKLSEVRRGYCYMELILYETSDASFQANVKYGNIWCHLDIWTCHEQMFFLSEQNCKLLFLFLSK